MKKKYFFLIFFSYIFLVSNCSKKSDNKPNVVDLKAPTLTTIDISSITRKSALSGGVITSDGGSTVASRGVIWSTSQNPTISLATKTSDSTVVGSNGYTSFLSGLAPNTTYYVVAYATNSQGTAYGNQISFKTSSSTSRPTLSTSAVSSITGTTAISGGNVTDDGGNSITAEGVIWSTSLNLTTASTKTNDGTAAGTFTSKLLGLTPNTTYYVIAYATNSVGTAYGNQYSFKTTGASIPTLTTGAISSITGTTAVSGGNVTSDGGSVVTSRGIVWSTSPNPTIALASKTSDGTGTGNFTSSLSGLTPNTTYYVVAYVTNTAGTAYGSQISFKTNISIPAISGFNFSLTSSNSASFRVDISNDGGSAITAKGIIWSTSPNPIITLATKTIEGTGTNSFTSNLSGLAGYTTYYVCAYATNSVGTAYYGENGASFRTGAGTPPISSTTAISNITPSSAVSGGYVTDFGGGITAVGVVWSTNPNPTIALSTKTSDGTRQDGHFVSSLTELTGNTTYYVRAYATNSFGTNYGNEISFKTAIGPTLSTNAISNITQTTAVSGGIITDDGGSAVTARGVVWSTSPNPTYDFNKSSTRTDNGTGTGSFTSSLTGLISSLSYYVRAYAINSNGISYGNEIWFRPR